MLAINEEQYPIVFVYSQGATTFAELENYLCRFSAWLAGSTPFGIVLTRSNALDDQVDIEQSKAVHRLTVEWARQHRPQILRFCAGMALLLEPPDSLKNPKAAPQKGFQTMFGCPVELQPTPAAAEAWLRAQLQTHSPTPADNTSSQT
jgi:hypothetical protein